MGRLYRLSGGVPRVINVLCDRALLGAYVQGKERVDAATLAQAAREVFQLPAARRSPLRAIAAGVILLAGAALALALYRKEQGEPRPVAVQPGIAAPVVVAAPAEAVHPDPMPASAVDLDAKPASAAHQDTNPASAAHRDATPASGVHPDAKPEAALPDALQWPADVPIGDNRVLAYAALFRAWGADYQGGDACRRAEGLGLRCRSARGGLDELRELNRPAVLLLRDAQGREFHATLSALDDKTAGFALGAQTRTVAIGALAEQWSGQYTVLWRMPPDAHENIHSGERGPAVAWLSRELAQVQGRAAQPGQNPLFDQVLMRQVKQFQLAEGLIPDGVVGPRTLMRLAGMADKTAPKLARTQEEK
jgi:general secretion pathway protein A